MRYGALALKSWGRDKDGRTSEYVPFVEELGEQNIIYTQPATVLQFSLETANSIRQRKFQAGPRTKPRDERLKVRCSECDFREFCGRAEARAFRATN